MAQADEGWLRLREASARIGVSPGTLRAWADEGRVPSFRTPGGHRRFRVQGIESVTTARRSSTPGHPDSRWRLLEHSALGRVRLAMDDSAAPQQWYQKFSPAARNAHRELGRELIHLLVDALRHESSQLQARAADLGRRYARLHQRFHVPLSDAVAGLAFFRSLFFESVVEFGFGLGEPGAEDIIGWMKRLNSVVDGVLVAMVENEK